MARDGLHRLCRDVSDLERRARLSILVRERAIHRVVDYVYEIHFFIKTYFFGAHRVDKSRIGIAQPYDCILFGGTSQSIFDAAR